MSEIHLSKWESSGLEPEFESPCTILEPGYTLGMGGFGVVLECLSVNRQGRGSIYAIKILGDVKTRVAEHGYKTIQELLLRIRKADERRRQRGDPSLSSLPGLIGLPLACFEGDYQGQKIYGYVMYRLDTCGFQSLESLIEGTDVQGRVQYLSAPASNRIAVAGCFARLMNVLIDELEYLHCDINGPNLWVNHSESSCALIDFDSGKLLGITHSPSSFGKMGEWLAPEIIAETGLPMGDPVAKISRESELWSLMIGISYLLFLVHPLFFLKSLNLPEFARYFNQFSWPNCVVTYQNWNPANDATYHWLLKVLGQMPAYFVTAFDLLLRQGVASPAQRGSASEWCQILQGTGDPPEIYLFTTDQDVYAEGTSMRLQWWVNGASQVTILPDIGTVPNFGEAIVFAQHCKDYRLVAHNVFGTVDASVSVGVLMVPQISTLMLPKIKSLPFHSVFNVTLAPSFVSVQPF